MEERWREIESAAGAAEEGTAPETETGIGADLALEETVPVEELSREHERRAELRADERRRWRIRGWGEYVSFFVAKTLGVVLIFAGVCELAFPGLLAVPPKYPEVFAGLGASLLIGDKLAHWIHEFTGAIEGD